MYMYVYVYIPICMELYTHGTHSLLIITSPGHMPKSIMTMPTHINTYMYEYVCE